MFGITRLRASAFAVVAFLFLLATGATAGTSAKGTNLIEQHVSIQAPGYVIPGTFTRPRAGGAHARYPAVLLLHGTASQKDEVGDMYLRLAEKLAGAGYASLRIDFAGSGDSTLPETAFTYTEEVADTKTALGWLERNANVDADALGRVGFSQGGRVAATVAGTDSRVKAVATWSTWVEDGSTAYLLFGPEAYFTALRKRAGARRPRLPDVDVLARVLRVDQELAPAAGHRRLPRAAARDRRHR